MRRKLSPSPIETHRGDARPLVPARTSFVLPTAAALALALVGCSAPTVADGIVADPAPNKVKAAPPAPPAASPSVQPAIDPDPHELDGDVAVVKPVPITKTKVSPKIKPSATPRKLGGKPSMTHPTI